MYLSGLPLALEVKIQHIFLIFSFLAWKLIPRTGLNVNIGFINTPSWDFVPEFYIYQELFSKVFMDGNTVDIYRDIFWLYTWY